MMGEIIDHRGKVQVVENSSVDSVAPAGSVWSSAADMAKWMQFLLDGGRAVDFHTGSISGMVAIHGLIRDERLGVYVLANLESRRTAPRGDVHRL